MSLHGALPRLIDALRRAKYSGPPLDTNALTAGDPAAMLPLLHWALLDSSRSLAVFLAEAGCGFSPALSDARFVELAHKALRTHFDYKPQLTVQQLLAGGFAERKMLFILDVLNLCRAKHAELSKAARSNASPRGGRTVLTSPRTMPRTEVMKVLSDKLRVAPPAPIDEEERPRLAVALPRPSVV